MRVYRKNGLVRIYGREFNGGNWYDMPDSWLNKVNNDEWIIEGQEEAPLEEVLVEKSEANADDEESTDLSSLTKKELQALCDDREISYKNLDSKATLVDLLSSSADEEE